MRQRKPTMKTVSKTEAQQQFEQLLSEVASGKTSLTIEDEGKPVAVVLPVPVARDTQRRAARTRVTTTLAEMQNAANLTPDEAEELAHEAVNAVRAASDRS